ncbi:MAG: hypothetical protein P4L99_00970 [Chthoniobacter sp.]|nr:hypothetical protein [Chthoniobacter sp.]
MRHATVTILALLLAAVTGCGAEPEQSFAGWPKGWVETYQRFEKFIAAQKESVPASDLEFSPEGGISTSRPAEINPVTHTTVVFYRQGADILEMGMNGGLFEEGRQGLFPPGIYATCLMTCGKMVGYQYIHPLQWFQVEPAGAGDAPDGRNAGRMTIRTIEQPQPEADYWPNDRLLRFCDFQALPNRGFLAFFREISKVSPSVILAVTNAGVVQREKLDDALEKLLQWRIYCNGRLVEKGSAAEDLHHAVASGVGTYVAFVGVEGPDGFMPVSNYLQFPLFPERDGSMAVLPATSSGDGVPDCLRDALGAEVMDQLRRGLGWKDRFAGYNQATIYGLGTVSTTDAKKQAVISLWSAWAWSVNLAKVNPTSDIRRVNMVTGSKPDAK